MEPQVRNPDVDWYFAKPGPWQEAFARLRALVLGCGLAEELKWGHPCYVDGGKNVVLIHGFKGYCALLFFKGALLADEHGVLVQQTANVQAARQLRFTSAEEVSSLAAVVQEYVREAVEVERSGRQVERRRPSELDVPEELERAFEATPGLREAFAALTPGRQRAYLLHLGSAKRSETRAARVERCVDRILAGKGLDDR
ncbi:MAG: YdeI/OmpD-associated family protein [Thermoleophilia bacterium]